MRTIARVSVAGMFAVGAVLALAPMAVAAPGEQITSYDISVTIATNGNAHVTERIAYDFGSGERHGLTRTFPGRTLAGQPSVTSPDGASTVTTTTGNSIRIGNPDATVTGTHTYVLTYDLTGIVAPSSDTDTTLSWYVVDGSWDVPIAAVTETLTVPASATLQSCLAGGAVCDDNVLVSGNVLHISRNNVTPHQTVTVIATVPSAGFSQPTPSYTYTLSPTYTTASTTSDSGGSSSGSSAAFWVILLGGMGIVVAILAKAGRGSGGSRRSGGYYDNSGSYTSGYYDSGSSSSSYTDSGSSSSYTDSSSSSSSDSGSSSSSCGSGSW